MQLSIFQHHKRVRISNIFVGGWCMKSIYIYIQFESIWSYIDHPRFSLEKLRHSFIRLWLRPCSTGPGVLQNVWSPSCSMAIGIRRSGEGSKVNTRRVSGHMLAGEKVTLLEEFLVVQFISCNLLCSCGFCAYMNGNTRTHKDWNGDM